MLDSTETIGERIAKRRVDCGFNSQLALASALSAAEGEQYSKALIAKWELNQRHINSADIIALAKVLNCTSDYLLGLEAEPTHETTNIEEYTGLTGKIIDFLRDTNWDNMDWTDNSKLKNTSQCILIIDDKNRHWKLNEPIIRFIDWMLPNRTETGELDSSLYELLSILFHDMETSIETYNNNQFLIEDDFYKLMDVEEAALNLKHVVINSDEYSRYKLFEIKQLINQFLDSYFDSLRK